MSKIGHIKFLAHRGAFIAKQHSPQALFAVGVVGVAATAVLAARATLRLRDELDSIEAFIEKANDTEDSRAIVYARCKGVVRVAGLYAPTVIVGVATVAALTGAHVILNRRNAALVGAYASLDKALREYRSRVRETLGVDEEQRHFYGTEVVEGRNSDPDDPIPAPNIERLKANSKSLYGRFFDPLCTPWSSNPEYNLIFLKNQQQYFNDLLVARGHVFLNEVYDALGIPRSEAGQLVGWTTASYDGDNFVDFGFGRDDLSMVDFVNGNEGAVFLDFNVEGVIAQKVWAKKS